MKQYDRLEMFESDETPESWLWCLHCERCYQLKDMREIKQHGETYQMCHYSDCNGDTVMDGWNWNEFRENRKDLPETPELGVVYPQYPA